MKRRFPPQRDGFSLPEVLISSVLLSVVVVNTASIYNRSQNSIGSATLRDATYALISKDLEGLRAKSWKFACEGLTNNGLEINPPPSDFPPGSCTGLARDSGNSLAYKTGRRTPIEPFASSCSSSNLASLFVEKFALPGTGVKEELEWNSDVGTNLPSGFEKVSVKRLLVANRNELQVKYQTSSSSILDISFTATIVPQAAAFCP